MEERDRDLLPRWKEDWGKHFFRKPSRRRWALAGLAASLALLYWGLAFPDDPRTGAAFTQYFGLFEGLGVFFGSAAELLPEEQTTPAGTLRMWAGLFAVCGAVPVFAGMLPIR